VSAAPAASVSRIARRVTAWRRSSGLIPRSRVESSAISSCWGGEGLVRGSCIGLLLSGGDGARAASTKSASFQKVVEILQRRQRHARRADLHADAGRCVEHPGRYHRHDARQHLDVCEAPGRAIVCSLDADAAAEERVPAVVYDGKLPDMGRMSG
jgi:hypothetical protein